MARVTLYMRTELHRRWRESDWVNLSRLLDRALTAVLDREDGAETIYLCEVCQHRVGEALRITDAPGPPEIHTGDVRSRPPGGPNGRSPAGRNGSSAA